MDGHVLANRLQTPGLRAAGYVSYKNPGTLHACAGRHRCSAGQAQHLLPVHAWCWRQGRWVSVSCLLLSHDSSPASMLRLAAHALPSQLSPHLPAILLTNSCCSSASVHLSDLNDSSLGVVLLKLQVLSLNRLSHACAAASNTSRLLQSTRQSDVFIGTASGTACVQLHRGTGLYQM